VKINRRTFLGLPLAAAAAAGLGTFSAVEDASAVTLSGVQLKVTTQGGLNLRRSASWSGSIIKVVPYGTVLPVIGTNGDWFKVTSGSSVGYLNSSYTTLLGTKSVAITRGNPNRKMVALTFDAGSDLGNTESIINILQARGIPASFSLTGDWTDAYPFYAAWIAADFEIINHTLNHPSYTGLSTGAGALSPARRLSQLRANESRLHVVYPGTYKPRWRPPYGDYDAGVLRDVGALGYSRTLLWTIDSMGWNGFSADQIVNRVLSNVVNGAIVLMHVGGASHDADALVRVISGLKSRGYSFGTTNQVIA
jgi:peptidoglycan/xylan/chitin deacetylase (PgdA/CDA1 family)